MSTNKRFLSILQNSDEMFDEESQQQLAELWEQLEHADPAKGIDISEQEINQAYESVSAEMRSSQADNYSSNYIKFAAAAAVLLFAIGITYLLTPIKVSVPAGATKTIELADQSVIHLNSGSQISYSRLYNWWGRDVQLRGEAFFEVKESNQPFRVQTTNATIRVLGTKFNVRFWPSEDDNRTSVFLSEGRVTFKSLTTDKTVTLQPGEQSWISNSQPIPAVPVAIEKKRAIAWKQNSIAFEGQRLASVFAELQRRFNIKISAHPNIIREKITIYLSNIDSAESVIKDICRAKGLTYKEENNKFLLYRN